MALDAAIQNVGEYYAAHYLAEQFPKDIEARAKIWRSQGSQSPPRRLQALGDAYFRAKALALDYPDPNTRVTADELRGWHSRVLEALGYTPEPLAIELATEKAALAALLRLHRHQQPWLAVLESPFCLSDGDSLEEPLELPTPVDGIHGAPWPLLETQWERAIATLFKQEDRPRWALFLAGSRLYLFDAHTFTQGRYLYVSLDDAYARRQAKTFEAIAALLARDTLAPRSESDAVLHEALREGSLKSTHGVSEQLQGEARGLDRRTAHDGSLLRQGRGSASPARAVRETQGWRDLPLPGVVN